MNSRRKLQYSDPVTDLPESTPTPPRPGPVIRALTAVATLMLIGGVFLVVASLDHRNALRSRQIDVPTSGRPMLGSGNEPHTVVIYSDFRCPACATFHAEQLPALQAGAQGKANVVFVNRVLFGEPSVRAAVAAECAYRAGGVPAYQSAAEQLYAEARTHTRDATAWLEPAALRALVGVGDMNDFSACQADPAVSAQIRAESDRIARQGGATTPGVLVGGRTVSPPTADRILAALNRL